MAGAIGSTFDTPESGGWDTAFKYISHAASGCLLGAATSAVDDSDSEQGCMTGAGGAVIGEMVATHYRDNSEFQEAQLEVEKLLIENQTYIETLGTSGITDPTLLAAMVRSESRIRALNSRLAQLNKKGVDLAKLSAALVAFAAGADANGVNIAAYTGANAAEHNTFRAVELLQEGATSLASTIDSWLSAWKNEVGPGERLGLFISEDVGNWVLSRGVDIQQAIEDGVRPDDPFGGLVFDAVTNPLSPAYLYEAHLVGGGLAGMLDMAAPGGMLTDIMIRQAISESIVPANTLIYFANRAGVDLDSFDLNPTDFQRANFNRIGTAGQEAWALIENFDEIYEASADLVALAAEGDLNAQAQAVRFIVPFIPATAGLLVSGGSAAPAIGAALGRSATSLVRLLQEAGASLADINRVLPNNITIEPKVVGSNGSYDVEGEFQVVERYTFERFEEGTIPLREEFDKHLTSFDGVNGRKISGAHNEDVFHQLEDDGVVRILSQTKIEGGRGLYEIRYQVAKGKSGGGYTEEFKREADLPKTVYDPAIYPDDLMSNYAKQAAAKGYDEALKIFNDTDGKSRYYTAEYGGINFEVILNAHSKSGPYVGTV